MVGSATLGVDKPPVGLLGADRGEALAELLDARKRAGVTVCDEVEAVAARPKCCVVDDGALLRLVEAEEPLSTKEDVVEGLEGFERRAVADGRSGAGCLRGRPRVRVATSFDGRPNFFCIFSVIERIRFEGKF